MDRDPLVNWRLTVGRPAKVESEVGGFVRWSPQDLESVRRNGHELETWHLETVIELIELTRGDQSRRVGVRNRTREDGDERGFYAVGLLASEKCLGLMDSGTLGVGGLGGGQVLGCVSSTKSTSTTIPVRM